MTVTRLGRDFPLLTSGLAATTQIPPSGSSGQVPTANGSNGVSWGENIARITANGSNALLGPFVSVLSGTGVSFAVASNSLTISSSATNELPWYDMKVDGGLIGDGIADDTAAFQAAITAGTASGTQSRTFYFPPGTYLIGGALQDTGARNAQILLPTVLTSAAQITIRFVGAARPPVAVAGPIPAPGGYSIIKSTLTGASGTAACIGAGNQVFPSKNNISVVIEDIVCLAPTNPTFTFWNLMSTQGGATHNLMISTTWWGVGAATEPTNTNAYGLRVPQRGQSNYTYIDGICVYGFYTGVQLGELSVANGIVVSHDIVGVELTSAPHGGLIIHMQNTGCKYGIRVVPGSFQSSFDVLLYSAEHYSTPAWAVTQYDLDDPSNELFGHIRWINADNSGPVDHIFNVNGGANSTNAEYGPLSNVPGGAAGGDLSGTYPNPSVVDDSHNHTASTVTGISGGHILLADGHATPFAFTDMLQMDDGSDFLWSDP